MDTNILYLVIAGVVGLIIGYFLGKSIKKSEPSNLSELKQKNARLQANLNECISKQSVKGPSAASTSSSIANSFASSSDSSEGSSGESDNGPKVMAADFNGDAAKAVFGKRIKENDLTVVEGIGPKIQELFHNHDVKTWAALAGCTEAKCKDVLLSGGDRFKMHKPGTWPRQAGLAAEGKWQELLDWQDALDGGK